MTGNYIDQVERMLRSYNRLPEWSVFLHDMEITPDILDNYVHFFQDCHHLTDWVKEDTNLDKRIRNEVENYLTNNEAFKFIRSIANATKHLKLLSTKNITDVDFFTSDLLKTDKKKYSLAIMSEQADKGYDALRLATEGIKAWKKFFEENNLYKINVLDRSHIEITDTTDSSILFRRPSIR